MVRYLRSVLILFILVNFANAQSSLRNDFSFLNTSSKFNIQKKFSPSSTKSTSKLKPEIAIGVGVFSFYGDLYNKHFQSPTLSRISYNLSVSQELNKFLQFNIILLRGKLGADERFAADHRNLNFLSTITSGGVGVLYNFGNFLPEDRIASPFVSLGAELFKFNSKTDLYDDNGNLYYYWDDGSIRNLPHSDPNFINSTIIKRDYKYETDIRALNADGFGNYSLLALGVPIGAGVDFKINDFINFKLSTTFHFTTTDYIDGVTAQSVGNRAGNSKKDKFLYTFFSLSYTFGKYHNEMKEPDMKELDAMDLDNDKVVDLRDECPGTLPNIPVNSYGCPYDDDNDGVPNYRDDEPGTPSSVFVDERGIRLSDSVLQYRMNVYLDSTGAYSQHVIHDHNEATAHAYFYDKEFMVDLGTYVKQVPTSTLIKLISVKDVVANNFSKTVTMYTSGNFDNIKSAELRKLEMIENGFTNAKVIYRKQGEFHNPEAERRNRINSTPTGVSQPIVGNNTSAINLKNTASTNSENKSTNNNTISEEDNTAQIKAIAKSYESSKTMSEETKAGADKINIAITDPNSPLNTESVVMTVQLGAFTSKLPKEAFEEIKDLIEVKTDDGLFKYTCGVYTDYETALRRKNEMIPLGYDNAFITAYQQGRRITLASAGAPQGGNTETTVQPIKKITAAPPESGIVFKIQVGKYKTNVSVKKLNELMKIQGLNAQEDGEGNTRYLVGEFTDYANAKDYKAQLIKRYDLKDAFIIAFKNNEIIPAKEALKLINQ